MLTIDWEDNPPQAMMSLGGCAVRTPGPDDVSAGATQPPGVECYGRGCSKASVSLSAAIATMALMRVFCRLRSL